MVNTTTPKRSPELSVNTGERNLFLDISVMDEYGNFVTPARSISIESVGETLSISATVTVSGPTQDALLSSKEAMFAVNLRRPSVTLAPVIGDNDMFPVLGCMVDDKTVVVLKVLMDMSNDAMVTRIVEKEIACRVDLASEKSYIMTNPATPAGLVFRETVALAQAMRTTELGIEPELVFVNEENWERRMIGGRKRRVVIQGEMALATCGLCYVGENELVISTIGRDYLMQAGLSLFVNVEEGKVLLEKERGGERGFEEMRF